MTSKQEIHRRHLRRQNRPHRRRIPAMTPRDEALAAAEAACIAAYEDAEKDVKAAYAAADAAHTAAYEDAEKYAYEYDEKAARENSFDTAQAIVDAANAALKATYDAADATYEAACTAAYEVAIKASDEADAIYDTELDRINKEYPQ